VAGAPVAALLSKAASTRRESTRHDATSRIMSVSFETDPAEQADIMLEAGRRFTATPSRSRGWPFFAGAVAFGAAIGIVMEAYRRLLLAPLFDGEVTPLNIVVLQLLPFLLLIAALLHGRARRIAAKRRQALIDRLAPNVFIDMDIFRDGIRASVGPTTLSLEWSAIRDVSVKERRIEFEAESLVLYIPDRAFPDRSAFEAAGARLIALWRESIQPVGTDQGPVETADK